MQLVAICIVAFVAAATAQRAPEFVQGIPDRTPATRADGDATTAAPEAEAKCKKGTAGGMCVDCSKLLLCDGKGETPLAELVCSVESPGNSYCVKNQCTDKPDEADEKCKKASDISCTFEGYMPDPKNCSKYYHCDSAGGEATPYSCPVQYAYDHNTTMCRIRRTAADCATLPCKPGKFTSYAPDKSVYAFCDRSTNKTTVFRCEDEQYEWFNEKTLSCGVVCRKQGPFPDRKDCKKYYACFVVSGKWKMDHVTCPKGTQFNKDQLKCVKGDDCKPEISPEGEGGDGGATTDAPTGS